MSAIKPVAGYRPGMSIEDETELRRRQAELIRRERRARGQLDDVRDQLDHVTGMLDHFGARPALLAGGMFGLGGRRRPHRRFQ